mgnify:CR=1 FL=1
MSQEQLSSEVTQVLATLRLEEGGVRFPDEVPTLIGDQGIMLHKLS